MRNEDGDRPMSEDHQDRTEHARFNPMPGWWGILAAPPTIITWVLWGHLYMLVFGEPNIEVHLVMLFCSAVVWLKFFHRRYGHGTNIIKEEYR